MLRSPDDGDGKPFAAASRETLLLLNNLLLVAACAMVLLGTLYPLLADALDLGKISVGPPYFSLLFVLLMAPLVLLAASADALAARRRIASAGDVGAMGGIGDRHRDRRVLSRTARRVESRRRTRRRGVGHRRHRALRVVAAARER